MTTTLRTFVAATAVITLTAWFVSAQETAAPAPVGPATAAATAATAAPQGSQKAKEPPPMTLWRMWVVGGPVMYPIGLCSVLAVGLVIYGFMYTTSDKMLRPDLVPQLQDALDKLDVEAATTICNGTPCTLTNILGAGLKRISDGILDVSSMEKAMEEASVEETNEGMKPLNNLSVTSQIAPMLGLLGTVTGMIHAFNKIGLGMMGDPEKLANDIGEAMLTTAFGLMVAIPAMFAYFYLKAKYTANISRLSRILGSLLHHLVVASRRVESEATGQAQATAGGTAGEN